MTCIVHTNAMYSINGMIVIREFIKDCVTFSHMCPTNLIISLTHGVLWTRLVYTCYR